MLSLSCMVCKIKFMGPNVLGSLNIFKHVYGEI